jgi:hypothetical protein
MPSGRSSAGNSMPREGQLPPVIVTREGWLLLIHLSRSAAARPVGHRTAGTSRHFRRRTTRLVDSWMGYPQVRPPRRLPGWSGRWCGRQQWTECEFGVAAVVRPPVQPWRCAGATCHGRRGHALSGFRSANIVGTCQSRLRTTVRLPLRGTGVAANLKVCFPLGVNTGSWSAGSPPGMAGGLAKW